MLGKLDSSFINLSQRIALPFARFAIFVIYFWFGLLKVVGESPANPLVSSLLDRTMPFITFEQFIIAFGLFEMIIGLLFIIPKLERLALILLGIHIVMTIMPLFLLPAIAWTKPFVPTLEGQYMIKNLAIIGLALLIGSNLKKS